MPMSTHDRAKLAAAARWRKASPEERSEAAAQSYLLGAATTVLKRFAELPEDVQAQIRLL